LLLFFPANLRLYLLICLSYQLRTQQRPVQEKLDALQRANGTLVSGIEFFNLNSGRGDSP
jgi:hypothetical protein